MVEFIDVVGCKGVDSEYSYVCRCSRGNIVKSPCEIFMIYGLFKTMFGLLELDVRGNDRRDNSCGISVVSIIDLIYSDSIICFIRV